MDLSQADIFFQNHPLREKYFSFSDAERTGILAVAERDVNAAVAHCPVGNGEYDEFINAAIAEQTIFLMVNPEYITGEYTALVSVSDGVNTKRFSSGNNVLGQRAAALLVPLSAAAESQSESGESNAAENAPGNDPDGDNGKNDEDESFCGSLNISRG